ncbi:putative esterase [Mycolicibacterium chubuense NBB4]|uniref:Putative esterase n=1 Tax=Mycolicibacterium chubuense (strain NBB4) TaxID=710421 RepID=I4BKQ6_MYCCN|nr:alpha/beta fold hydrolase [Mycolicibacterium chubuense]AFM17863.1 putative esterase [Mycolicibacterium chubuense NBB4]
MGDGHGARLADGLSLAHGCLPVAIQGVAVVALLCAVGWRSARWRLAWLPVSIVVGVLAVLGLRWYVKYEGMADNPALPVFWVWVGLTGVAVGVAVLGWRATQWWRRGLSLIAVALAVLSCGITLNMSVGYFTTAQMAWGQLTGASLPDQAAPATVSSLRRSRALPAHGTVIAVRVGSSASGFKHRAEYVYLPPAWFASDPPPTLPAVMMIPGQFNTPADWIRQGNTVTEIDRFAARHHGYAPVLVFADVGGSFGNDTECVNGPRGNVDDHLVKDIVPFVTAQFGVSRWGAVGWSMGGTCAVNLAARHPETFSTFVDIAGDLSPAAGNDVQTTARLFGGDSAARAAFDTPTVIQRHGPYRDVAGWFAVSIGKGASQEWDAAERLCRLGRVNHMSCTVARAVGKHDWPFAEAGFAAALPWLAARLGTPAVGAVGPPDSSSIDDALHS